jgi:hypothetical protein
MHKKMIATVALTSAMLLATQAIAAPFGGSDDVSYSKQLWKVLTESGYVGKHVINGTPYTGQPPHGAILDTIDGEVTVGGTKGAVIVKRNYGGEGVSKESVANNPDEYLKAVTVMFKRSGYDPENKNWFWVKYKPDGSLHTNPKGMMLAGKVAKGMPQGCIACHQSAAGGDYVFNNDRIQ